MPRAVSPWTWRLAIRDHWHGHTSVMFTLYTIGTYMDRTGMAYPSQKTLATSIRATVKTVQRHIETAERAGFLGVNLAGRGGKGWRHYVYQAAIPDNIVLSEQEEYVATAIVAEVGDIEGGDKSMSPPPPQGYPRRGDNPPAMVATSEPVRGDIPATSWRQADVALTPASRTLASRTHTPEEARLSPSARVQEHNTESRKPEARAAAGPERFASPAAVDARGLAAKKTDKTPKADDITDRRRRIKVLLTEQPELITDWSMAAKVMRVPREEIGAAAAELYTEKTAASTTSITEIPL